LGSENKYSIFKMSKSNHSNPDKRKIVKKKNRLIFLIGFMASGKTYLGTRVSAALGIPFADMDEEIIAQKKKSINQIFEEEGEEGFRKIERKVLESFIQSADNRNTPLIISTGGGAPCFYDNMDLMKENGRTIFIDPSAEILAERLAKEKEERPLIREKSSEEILLFIQEKLAERLPFYRQADILLNPIRNDPEADARLMEKIIGSVLHAEITP